MFEVDNLYYITQVSHPQARHQEMTQQKDFYKLYDPNSPTHLIAVVNLNYMFPIPKECTHDFVKKKIDTYRTFKSEKDKSKYIDLLDTELKIINTLNLDKKAIRVYNLKYDKPEDAVSKRCIDFRYMEKLARIYI